jgi:hypothetical protein
MARCGSIAAHKRTPTQESLPIGLPQGLMRIAWFPAAELGQINHSRLRTRICTVATEEFVTEATEWRTP